MSSVCRLSQAQNQSFSRWITGLLLLVVIFLQFCTTIVSSSSLSHGNYRKHAERERDQPGRSGEPPVPSYHLLKNNCSGKLVRFMPKKKLDALGTSLDRYSGLQLTSVSFEGLLYIQNAKTHRYLCFNKRGKLKLKYTKDSQCIFKETPVADAYRYQSHQYSKFYLGFNKNGKKLKGSMPRNKKRQRCYTFLKSSGPHAITDKKKPKHRPLGDFHRLHRNTTHNIRHGSHHRHRRGHDVR